jgi:hypothetical protein
VVSDPGDLLDEFELWRVDAFESLDEPEEAVARLVSPFRLAHALGTGLLWCLVSPGRPDAPGLSWILGLGGADGEAGAAAHRAALGALRLPAGATVAAVPHDAARQLLAGCEEWVALQATIMPREAAIDSDELRGALLAQLVARPFACVVHAVPTPGEQIDDELLSVDQVARMGQLEGRAEFASSRASTELATERYGDLTGARQLGGWSVEIDVGGRTGESAVVAELVAAALDVAGLSFQVLRGGLPARTTLGPTASPIAASDDWRRPRRRFVASTRQLATMLRPPVRELPGVALRQQMPFDLNAEGDGARGGDGGGPDGPGGGHRGKLDLGATLDSGLRPSGRFEVDTSTLNRHALVCGATGSGKTQTVQRLLEQLTALGVPWLVVEPVKAEYRSMPARLRSAGLHAPVHVLRLGDPDAPPLSLNPLEPEPGFPLQTHVDMVAALFVASFDAAEPFPQILAEALRRCYADLGWVLATGECKRNELGRPATRGESYPRYPTLADLQRTARAVVHDVGYGPEVRDNVLGFVDVRLGSLRHGTPGRFFEGGHPLDLAAVHRSNVVVEVEDVGNDLDKAFVIGTVVLRLYEHLRVAGPTGEAGLTHVTVVEEAHRLLRRSEPGARRNQAVELFGALLAEVRAFGEGIVIAEQIPVKILPDVLKNTAVQIVHRLPSVEDRAVLAGTTNMDEDQSAFLVALRPGLAAGFREGMDAPILLAVDPPGSPPDGSATTALPVATSAPAGGLIRNLRGVGCDPGCVAVPCTGRRLVMGPQLAQSIPELPFWIELAFLAFVSETAVPRPQPAWAAQLRDRLGLPDVPGCALGGLVEATVEARWTEVGDFYAPTCLTEAIISAARAILLDRAAAPSTRGYAAGRFVVRDVYHALVAAGDSADPHPRSAIWREELGLDLIDAPAAEQLDWLERSPIFTYAGRQRLLMGGAPPSRLEELARPLAAGVTDAPGLAIACARVTPDHTTCMQNLADWFDLPPPPHPTASSTT